MLCRYVANQSYAHSKDSRLWVTVGDAQVHQAFGALPDAKFRTRSTTFRWKMPQ